MPGSSTVKRIGLLTGGGDCPGLNAVIRSVVKDARTHGLEVVGILDGMLGLIENRTRPLDADDVAGILAVGGTILGSSNKANPARHPVGKNADGSPVFADVTDRCLATLEKHAIDALVLVGGDGTMSAATSLTSRGVNCIGLPKTIDNDLVGTELTFGFQTALQTTTEAIDRVRTTAQSHHRVMVVEVMGRNAGWLTLNAGIASGADVILIPELPYDIQAVARFIERRRDRGRRFSIVCVAEGARPLGGEQVVQRIDPTSPDPVRLGGIAQRVAARLEELTGIESRYVVLGHVVRGGTPVAGDRVLATLLGDRACDLLLAGARDRLIAVQNNRIVDIPIRDAADKQRLVPPDHPLLAAVRNIGATLGLPEPPAGPA